LGSLSYTTLDGIHLSSWADVGGKLVAVTPRLPPRRAVAVFNTPLRVGLVLDIHSVHLHDVVVVDVHDLVVARPDDLDDARRVPLPTPASLDALSFLVHHLCQQHFRFTFSNCKRSSGDSESIHLGIQKRNLAVTQIPTKIVRTVTKIVPTNFSTRLLGIYIEIWGYWSGPIIPYLGKVSIPSFGYASAGDTYFSSVGILRRSCQMERKYRRPSIGRLAS
jgi:hypothetical protein